MTEPKSGTDSSQAAALISETVLDLITVARAGLDQAEGIAKNPEAMAAALDTAGFLMLEFLKEVRGLVGVLAKAVGSDDASTSTENAPANQTAAPISETTVDLTQSADSSPNESDSELADILDIRAG